MRRFHSHLLRILKRSSQPAPGQGFTLAEPLVFIVLMALTVAGAAAMISISSRGTIGARIQSQQATAILVTLAAHERDTGPPGGNFRPILSKS